MTNYAVNAIALAIITFLPIAFFIAVIALAGVMIFPRHCDAIDRACWSSIAIAMVASTVFGLAFGG